MRSLGVTEHGIWRMDLGAPLNFTTVARVRGPLHEDALRRGLRRLRDGALSAAMILEILADAGVPRARISFGSPVNVREHLEPRVGEQVGFFVSMVGYRAAPRADAGLWDVARSVRRSLKADLERDAGLSMLRVLPLVFALAGGVRETPKRMCERWERLAPTTAGLTNLGRLAIETTHGPLSIEECHFAASPSALGDFAATATTLHGRLHWNFIWPDPALTVAHAEALIEAIERRLRRALDEGSG